MVSRGSSDGSGWWVALLVGVAGIAEYGTRTAIQAEFEVCKQENSFLRFALDEERRLRQNAERQAQEFQRMMADARRENNELRRQCDGLRQQLAVVSGERRPK